MSDSETVRCTNRRNIDRLVRLSHCQANMMSSAAGFRRPPPRRAPGIPPGQAPRACPLPLVSNPSYRTHHTIILQSYSNSSIDVATIRASHCQTLCDNLRVRIHTRSIISVIRDITGRAPREKTSGDCIDVHLTASGCTWRVPTACAGGGHVPCRCSRCPGTGTCERCAGPCLISVMS